VKEGAGRSATERKERRGLVHCTWKIEGEGGQLLRGKKEGAMYIVHGRYRKGGVSY